MADLPVKPSRPASGNPPGENDNVEKSTQTKVSIFSRIVPDGTVRHQDKDYARMTLVMRPALPQDEPVKHPKDEPVNLRCWPSEVLNRTFTADADAKSLKTTLRVVTAQGLTSKDDIGKRDERTKRAKTFDAKIMWRTDSITTARIDRFWRRMMNPLPRANETRTVWERLVEALVCKTDDKPGVLLPTPHGAAALTFTLARGRMVLDALAAPDSPLAARDSVQHEANLARPWYQGERRIRVARLASDLDLPAIGQSPEDSEYWTAPYRARTAAMLAGETPDPIWPPPQTFAAAALAGGARSADLIERVHAAHHLTTSVNPSYPACSSEDEALDTARRRLGALLSLPTLQRLFGFAFDLMAERGKLEEAIETSRIATETPSPFILIAPENDDTWTLARYETRDGHLHFCPADWSELEGQFGETAFGLRHLGRKDEADIPRYDIITIDPGLATEGDINHSAKGPANPVSSARDDAIGSALSPADSGVPVLHNGGLRVIVLPDELRDETVSSACPEVPAIHHAGDLKSGERLMIGVKTANGMMWRSPDYRAIKFEDPWSDTAWVETEIARRLYPSNARRRLELDGSMAMPAVQRIKDDFTGPAFGKGDASNPVFREAVKIIADCTLALWGSDPGGVPPPDHDREGNALAGSSTPVVEELDVTRRFSAPSSKAHDPQECLSPSLRFGWPYHAVLATVFEGGGCADIDQVGAIVRADHAIALPDIGKSGRRFLRHERVNAPMALILESDFPGLTKADPPQRSADMYVRSTANAKFDVPNTRRLIVPPPVPLQFAMLHDVLRGLGKGIAEPRQGLDGLSLLGRPKDQMPSRVRVGGHGDPKRRDAFYYPDPAASVLVFGLKLPREKGLERAPFLEQTVAVPIGARTWPDGNSKLTARVWPDVLPVHVTLKRTHISGTMTPRVRHRGQQWLKAGEELISHPARGAVPVQAVEIHLAPGEDVLMQAWCVPTVNQLADWFDSIEAAAVLVLNDKPSEDKPSDDNPHVACIKGLERLLGTTIPLTDKNEAAVQACVGAGGLRAPPRSSIVELAGLVYRELLMRPIGALTGPLTMRMTHATDDTFIEKPTLGPRLAVTRRIFAAPVPTSSPDPAAPILEKTSADDKPDIAPGNQPSDFLNDTPASDWGLSSTQEGATGALFGGDIRFDAASTSGLIIEAQCAAPSGEPLDPETGRTQTQRLHNDWTDIDPNTAKSFGFTIDNKRQVTFQRRNVVVLKFDGLPLPADGRAGPRTYSLEELMAGAWGARRPFGDALRAALPAAFSTSGARRLWLRAVAINRHAGLLPAPPKKKEPVAAGTPSIDAVKETTEKWEPREPFDVWLPATTRPSPPVIDHVSVALMQKPMQTRQGPDGSFTVGVEQICMLTIWHARPFFSSGEDERLALVLWPPGLFARGIDQDEKGKELFPLDKASDERPEFYDEDLGPGGPYVTRWAADPLTGDNVSSAKFPTGPLLDPARLPDGGLRVPHAMMPVPVAGEMVAAADGAAPDAAAAKPADRPPSVYLAVALQAFEPKFDPVEELWFFSVALRTDPLPFPRVRLGLVRYQPHAREDDQPFEGSEPVRLRVSTPVPETVKPLPGRKATATCRTRKDGKTEIIVVVSGPLANPKENAKGIQAGMMVEIIRHKQTGGVPQEETARDEDGHPLKCWEWSTNAFDEGKHGLMRNVADGQSWTCLFVLPDLGKDGWSHSAIVTETRKVSRAKTAKHQAEFPSSKDHQADTGPNFIARMLLSPNPND